MGVISASCPRAGLNFFAPVFESYAPLRWSLNLFLVEHEVVRTRVLLLKLSVHVAGAVPVLLALARQSLGSVDCHDVTSYLFSML